MAKAPSRGLKFTATRLDSAVLSKIHAEIGRRSGAEVAKFDTHIKGVCDIHGKGDHIKGSGPNYYKTSSRIEIDPVLTDYGSLVERLAVDVAAKIRERGPR